MEICWQTPSCTISPKVQALLLLPRCTPLQLRLVTSMRLTQPVGLKEYLTMRMGEQPVS